MKKLESIPLVRCGCKIKTAGLAKSLWWLYQIFYMKTWKRNEWNEEYASFNWGNV